MFKFIKDLLAPKKCYSCGKEGLFLCEKCFEEIEKHYFFDQICYVCKKYSKNFEVHDKCKIYSPLQGGDGGKPEGGIFYDKTIILTHYKIKIIKKLISDFKFYYKKEIANDFADLLSEKIIKYCKNELKEYRNNDFVVVATPVPFFRKLIRGYNQAELLAKKIAEKFSFNFEKDLVLKNKYTRQQSKLTKQKRLSNLKNSFKMNKNKVDILDNKIVFLVDDVISTGTTVNEISMILKNYNAKTIIVITIASGY